MPPHHTEGSAPQTFANDRIVRTVASRGLRRFLRLGPQERQRLAREKLALGASLAGELMEEYRRGIRSIVVRFPAEMPVHERLMQAFRLTGAGYLHLPAWWSRESPEVRSAQAQTQLLRAAAAMRRTAPRLVPGGAPEMLERVFAEENVRQVFRGACADIGHLPAKSAEHALGRALSVLAAMAIAGREDPTAEEVQRLSGVRLEAEPEGPPAASAAAQDTPAASLPAARPREHPAAEPRGREPAAMRGSGREEEESAVAKLAYIRRIYGYGHGPNIWGRVISRLMGMDPDSARDIERPLIGPKTTDDRSVDRAIAA